MELGWTLARPYWGQGLALEGALAALAWGFREHPDDRIISLIHKENLRSRRLALALGLHFCREVSVLGQRVEQYGIRRSDPYPRPPKASANTCTP